MTKVLSVLAAVVVLVACSAREETRTVEYYLAHPDEMTAKALECGKNPGEKRNEPNCVNAAAAMKHKSAGKNDGMRFTP